MNFTLYTLPNNPTTHITIAYEVDCYFWQAQGITPYMLTFTHSMSKAMSITQHKIQPQTIEYKSMNLPFVNPLKECQWKDIMQQATLITPFLQGRSLLWPEVISLLHKHELEFTESQLAALLQYLYLHNKVNFSPGITLEKAVSKWLCNRCFAAYSSIQKIECATCGEECAMCEQCLLLGRSRACSLLLQFTSNQKRSLVTVRSPSLTLTSAQLKVSENIDQFLDSPKRQALVWAVTGAGKTEMLIPSVWKSLSAGKRVLWVTPRKDVVIEIAPRLWEFFPTIPIVALYGGSEDAWQDGDLVIATAHQAWRYYHSFDLAIIDEVDAFPLYGDESLEKGIQRALHPEAKQVFLTATPPDRWKRAMHREGCLFVLPVRYHEYPLPVPKLFRKWFLERKLRRNLPIPTILQFVQKVIENQGQAFIFVPRTRDVQKLVDWLIKQGVAEKQITGVYSQDLERKEKVQQFRQGVLTFLVTTTILERGVTVPRCFVLVWRADHPVFDAPSLIQIAGRVGRSKEYQLGEVWFLCSERTESQRKAKKEIEWLNRQAEKEGFIRKGAYYP